MAHYAILDENNLVVKVINGIDETELIEGKDPETWYGDFYEKPCKRTSYNTRNGKHYNHETGKWSKERQFRGNYAGIGFIYNEDLDAFIPQKPFDSWLLNSNIYAWEAPIPYPEDGNYYRWDESKKNWVLVEEFSS